MSHVAQTAQGNASVIGDVKSASGAGRRWTQHRGQALQTPRIACCGWMGPPSRKMMDDGWRGDDGRGRVAGERKTRFLGRRETVGGVTNEGRRYAALAEESYWKAQWWQVVACAQIPPTHTHLSLAISDWQDRPQWMCHNFKLHSMMSIQI